MEIALRLQSIDVDSDNAASVENLNLFCREFTDTYSGISKSLSLIGGDLRFLREKILALKGEEQSTLTQVAIDETRGLMGIFQARLDEINTFNSEAVAITPKLEMAAEQIKQAICNIDLVSGKLRFVGLNATIAAENIGRRVNAFGVLTKELTALSDKNANYANDVLKILDGLDEEVKNIVSLKNTFDMEHLESRAKADNSYSHIYRTLKELFENLDSLSLQTDEFLDRVGQIMILMQRQDIIRQSVEHIAKIVRNVELELHSIKELESDDRDKNAGQISLGVVFVQQATSLAISLLDHCKTEVTGLSNEIREAFGFLGESLTTVHRSREAVDVGLRQQIEVPQELVRVASDKLFREVTVCSELETMVLKLQVVLKELEQSLVRLSDFTELLNGLKTITRIIVAQIDDIPGGESIAKEVSQGQRLLTQYVRQAESPLYQLEKMSNHIAARLRGTRLGFQDSLEYLLREGVKHPTKIMVVTSSFLEGISDLTLASQRIQTIINDSVEHLNFFEQKLNQLDVVRSVCVKIAGVSESYREWLQQEGVFVDPGDLVVSRMKSLVDLSAILEQKQIASCYVGGEKAEGDDKSMLTLFEDEDEDDLTFF